MSARNKKARQRHLDGVRWRKARYRGSIVSYGDEYDESWARFITLGMVWALGACCVAFLAALLAAAIYLPLPRDNHLPPPAAQSGRG